MIYFLTAEVILTIALMLPLSVCVMLGVAHCSGTVCALLSVHCLPPDDGAAH